MANFESICWLCHLILKKNSFLWFTSKLIRSQWSIRNVSMFDYNIRGLLTYFLTVSSLSLVDYLQYLNHVAVLVGQLHVVYQLKLTIRIFNII